MEFTKQLPADAQEIETFMHDICDHYGWADATVSIKTVNNIQQFTISYKENKNGNER